MRDARKIIFWHGISSGDIFCREHQKIEISKFPDFI